MQPGGVTVIGRRGDLQHPAYRLDPERVAVAVNEIDQDLSPLSSSAWAKDALASLRISWARRSSLTSRSSALMRSRSSVLRPSRTPTSISSCLTQSLSVWRAQPILGAIDSIAHREGVLTPVFLHHPHGSLTHLGGKTVGLLAVHGSIFSE